MGIVVSTIALVVGSTLVSRILDGINKKTEASIVRGITTGILVLEIITETIKVVKLGGK